MGDANTRSNSLGKETSRKFVIDIKK
jgi:hypothetical protein